MKYYRKCLFIFGLTNVKINRAAKLKFLNKSKEGKLQRTVSKTKLEIVKELQLVKNWIYGNKHNYFKTEIVSLLV